MVLSTLKTWNGLRKDSQILVVLKFKHCGEIAHSCFYFNKTAFPQAFFPTCWNHVFSGDEWRKMVVCFEYLFLPCFLRKEILQTTNCLKCMLRNALLARAFVNFLHEVTLVPFPESKCWGMVSFTTPLMCQPCDVPVITLEEINQTMRCTKLYKHQ